MVDESAHFVEVVNFALLNFNLDSLYRVNTFVNAFKFILKLNFELFLLFLQQES